MTESRREPSAERWSERQLEWFRSRRRRIDRTLGPDIVRRRKQLGWSQQRLADELGVTRRAVRFLERSERRPGYTVGQRLERFLGREVEYTPPKPKPEPETRPAPGPPDQKVAHARVEERARESETEPRPATSGRQDVPARPPSGTVEDLDRWVVHPDTGEKRRQRDWIAADLAFEAWQRHEARRASRRPAFPRPNLHPPLGTW